MLDRLIYLNGMPNSGKSSLGRRAARDLRLPFTDLDQWIEGKSGMTIPEIFDRYGESTFRRMETIALATLTRNRPGLIALGGGTAMTEENRKIMQAWGSVILLDRPVEQILAEIRTDGRPMLREHPEETMRKLYEIRMPVYRELADVRIPADREYERTLALLERVLRERYHA